MHAQYLTLYHSEDEIWFYGIVVLALLGTDYLKSYRWLNMCNLNMFKERNPQACLTGGLGTGYHTRWRGMESYLLVVSCDRDLHYGLFLHSTSNKRTNLKGLGIYTTPL